MEASVIINAHLRLIAHRLCPFCGSEDAACRRPDKEYSPCEEADDIMRCGLGEGMYPIPAPKDLDPLRATLRHPR